MTDERRTTRSDEGAELPARLRALLSTLDLFPDRADRIQFLISVADRYRPVPEEVAVKPYPERRRVPHCESDAYVWALAESDGTMRLYFAVENPQGISAMAMAAILADTLSGSRPEEILSVPSDLPYRIFGRELSMGKTMGLLGMVGMVQAAARQVLSGGLASGDNAAERAGDQRK